MHCGHYTSILLTDTIAERQAYLTSEILTVGESDSRVGQLSNSQTVRQSTDIIFQQLLDDTAHTPLHSL